MMLAGSVGAQGQLDARHVTVIGENLQIRNRLLAIDRSVQTLKSPEEIACVVGFGAAGHFLRTAAGCGQSIPSLEKWEKALDEYLSLMHEEGETLVPAGLVSKGSSFPAPSVQVRRLVQARLCTMPLAARRLYDRRVEVRAKRLLQEGIGERWPRPLLQLVDEMFASSVTDQALDCLGDLAFERGDFQEAHSWWRRLAPLPSEASNMRTALLFYPNSTIPTSVTQAKEILALGFGGQLEQARKELAVFRTLHAMATGKIAGQNGLLGDLMDDWLEKIGPSVAEGNELPWTTFGGNPARNRVLPVCPSSRLWIDGPAWRVRLAGAGEPDPMFPKLGPSKRVAVHPVIAQDRVLVADARAVWAYHLLSGKPAFHFDLKQAGLATPKATLADGGRATLTVAGGQVLARLGAQSLSPDKNAAGKDERSYLVALDLQTGRVHWHSEAQTPEGKPAFFEGAPVSDGQSYWCAVSWVVGYRTRTALTCYDSAGRQRWFQEVLEAPEFEEQQSPRRLPHLCTLGGGQLIYCNHAGAVVALEPATGQRLWATRYPSRGRVTADGMPSPRDLTPCVYDAGRIFVAPLDADGLLCIDAYSGRLLWERNPVEIVHLLGVARGRVYCTTTTGLQCVDAATGDERDGWRQPVEGKTPGLGSGLLAGSWAFWPTRDPKLPFRALSLDDGGQELFSQTKGFSAEPDFFEPTMLRALLPGNMAFGQGCLAIAGIEELAVYVPAKNYLPEREEKLKNSTRRAADLYDLALAQHDAGNRAAAHKLFLQLRSADDLWPALAERRLAELNGNVLEKQWHVLMQKTTAPLPAQTNPSTAASATIHLPLERVAEWTSERYWPVPCQPQWTPGTPFIYGMVGEALEKRDASGKLLWRQTVPWEINWLSDDGRVAVLASAAGIAAFDAVSGQALWTFPPRDLYAVRLGLRDGLPRLLRDAYAFSGFQRVGSLLIFLLDDRLLAALDVSTGKPAWCSPAPHSATRPLLNAGRFRTRFLATEHMVVAQTNASRGMILDTTTGKILRAFDTSHESWPETPLTLGRKSFVVGEAMGRVRFVNGETGATVWRYQPEATSSLTGASARVLGNQQRLLAWIPRNLGPELVRIDAATGKPLWSVSFQADEVVLESTVENEHAVFVVGSQAMQARGLDDGKLLWRRPLPSTTCPWRVVVADSCLVLCPTPALCLPTLPTPATFLSWPAVQKAVLPPSQICALWLCDPNTGQTIQRLHLGPGRSGPSMCIFQGTLIVSCEGRVSVFRQPKEFR
ncbi:MAG: PQQ-like beta-propeller repeat protein [Gemmataceae bacterium]|nr:PQQ-like beta-propeller repeat protein [Gemmataceae bacterium]MCI0739793.1 PQQ-like beta-propeller repeat protein [Gemmataceae bacterium]